MPSQRPSPVWRASTSAVSANARPSTAALFSPSTTIRFAVLGVAHVAQKALVARAACGPRECCPTATIPRAATRQQDPDREPDSSTASGCIVLCQPSANREHRRPEEQQQCDDERVEVRRRPLAERVLAVGRACGRAHHREGAAAGCRSQRTSEASPRASRRAADHGGDTLRDRDEHVDDERLDDLLATIPTSLFDQLGQSLEVVATRGGRADRTRRPRSTR